MSTAPVKQDDLEWRTFGEWLSKVEGIGLSPNYVPLVGHNTVRRAVMEEDFRREATPHEVKEMEQWTPGMMLSLLVDRTGFGSGSRESPLG